MEALEEKIEIKEEAQVNKQEIKKEKKKFTIFGFTIIQILAYFIIYSIVGYLLETIFGLLTKGVLESRKSFLYGPFCGIYGIGAIVMIMGLQKFKKNNYTLFVGGFLIGSLVEYVISLIGEVVFHIKWWDYSDIPFNLNGRICIWFSLFWGILAIYLMKHIHPIIDKFLNRFSGKTLKGTVIILTLLLLLNSAITGFALKMFFVRLVDNYNLELQNVDAYRVEYSELYETPWIKEIVDKHFSDEIMLKAFPNIKVTGKDGNIIWVSDILKHIQPYYIRIFTPKQANAPQIEQK